MNNMNAHRDISCIYKNCNRCYFSSGNSSLIQDEVLDVVRGHHHLAQTVGKGKGTWVIRITELITTADYNTNISILD